LVDNLKSTDVSLTSWKLPANSQSLSNGSGKSSQNYAQSIQRHVINYWTRNFYTKI